MPDHSVEYRTDQWNRYDQMVEIAKQEGLSLPMPPPYPRPQSEIICPDCKGEGSMIGRMHHGAMRNCTTCGGSGKLKEGPTKTTTHKLFEWTLSEAIGRVQDCIAFADTHSELGLSEKDFDCLRQAQNLLEKLELFPPGA